MVAKSIAYYFLPLSIIAVLYALMARRLNVSAREMPGELAGPQRAQARARRHVARMVVTFVIGTITLQHAIIYTFIQCNPIYNNTSISLHLYPFDFSVYHLLLAVSRLYALVSFVSMISPLIQFNYLTIDK